MISIMSIFLMTDHGSRDYIWVRGEKIEIRNEQNVVMIMSALASSLLIFFFESSCGDRLPRTGCRRKSTQLR
jgi:hypothetical protein